MELIPTDDVAATAAAVLEDKLRSRLSEGGRASLAVSGGETPWRALERLATAALPWERLDIFQVDERLVPPDHPARNLAKLRRRFSIRVAARLHPMPVDEANLGKAAARYAASLPAALDVVQLGLGADGHTASLMPGDPALDSDADVAATSHLDPYRRMTLTFGAINRARSIVWIVGGSSKRAALAALLAGRGDMPATRIAREQAVVVADHQALGWADD